MSVNQLLCNFPPNSNFQVPTSNQGSVTFSVGGPPGGAGPAPTVTQQVFVAPWGSDTAGDGGEETPFLTIAHAQASILDSAPTKIYQIILYPGVYTEAVALEAFVNIIGWNASNSTAGFYPSRVSGNFTLGASFGGPPTGQSCFVTSIDLDGALTLDYTGVGSTTAIISFTNVQCESAVVVTAGNGPATEFHNCILFDNFTQSGGTVNFYNTIGVNTGGLLRVNGLAGGIASFFTAYGGQWAGSFVADQNGADVGTPVALQSYGFGLNHGNGSLIASATDSPSLPANFGDLPENVALTGAAAALTPNMRLSHQFSVGAHAIGGVAAGPPAGPPFGVLTTIDLVVPAGIIGAVTSIESLQCSCSPVGSNWGSLFGPHAAIYAFRYEQAAGVPTIHFDILNTGVTFNISDALLFNFSAHLPVVL